MADQINTTNTPEKSGGAGIAFVVGILVVVVAIIAYVLFAGGDTTAEDGDINVTIEGAADAVEGAAEGATDGN